MREMSVAKIDIGCLIFTGFDGARMEDVERITGQTQYNALKKMERGGYAIYRRRDHAGKWWFRAVEHGAPAPGLGWSLRT